LENTDRRGVHVHDTDEAAEATAGEKDDHDVASQANREARVMVIARCEVDLVSLILIYKHVL
jgi:hypothetical protein